MFKRQELFANAGLTPLQQAALLQRLFPARNLHDQPDYQYTPGECLLIWLAMTLERGRLLDQDATDFVLQRASVDITAYGANCYENARAGGVPEAFVVVICDRNYVTWTGLEGFIDLRQATACTCLPHEALVSHSINLRALYARCAVQCAEAAQSEQENDSSITD